MPRKPSSRKYQLALNNPTQHGYTHDKLKEVLAQFSGLSYWCMCDEIGEQETPHTHVFVCFRNSVMFDTVQTRFYGAHIEMAKGSNQENREYVRKEGRWQDSEKKETNLADTFEEWGELPPDKSRTESQAEQIIAMVKDGKSNAQILAEFPGAYTKLSHIEAARQTLQEERYSHDIREVHVSYIWGETGAGKTRSVMEKYGFGKVYQITDYAHPFDNYKGQTAIIFDEFRSSLKIQEMLQYLDIYPLNLPCRYTNKVACFTDIFIISNIPLEKQYPIVQIEEPETWAAFRRRIHKVSYMARPFSVLQNDGFDPTAIFGPSEG